MTVVVQDLFITVMDKEIILAMEWHHPKRLAYCAWLWYQFVGLGYHPKRL